MSHYRTANHYDEMPNRRFFRRKDQAMVAGVCAGVADYFGFNLKVTRLVAFVAILMAMPVALLIYFAAALLVPSAPDVSKRTEVDPGFRQASRSSPGQTLTEVKRRFQTLDARLARLERHVTSPTFELDQQINNL